MLGKILRFLGRNELLEDWLPWLLPIDPMQPEIIMLRDGGLMRVAQLFPPDLETASPDQLNEHHKRVGRVLDRLGTGWTCMLDQWRTSAPGYLPGGNGPQDWNGSEAAWRIDRARAQQFDDVGEPVFQNSTFMTLTYRPRRKDALRRWVQENDAPAAEANINYFREQTNSVFNQLRLCMRGLEVLIGDPLASYLDASVGYQPGYRQMPRGIIAAQLKGHNWTTKPYPVVDGRHLATVELWNLGRPTPLTAEFLHELPFPLRWTTTLHGLDPEDRRTELQEVIKGWRVKQKSVGAILNEAFITKNSFATKTNPEADRALFDLDEMLADPHGRPFGLVHCNVHVTGTTRTQAEERAQRITSIFNGQGQLACVAEMNAVMAPLADIPGQGRPEAINIRRARIEMPTITRMAPVTGVNEGSRVDERFGGPALMAALTRRGVPLYVSLNAPGDDSAHTGLFGKTGAGKSALIAFMVAQFLRYRDAKAIVFDRGRSFFVPCLCLGGDWIELGGGGVGVQPLRNIHEPEELAWANGWLEMALRRRGYEPTAMTGSAINEALRHVAALPPDERTLSMFHAHLGGDASARAALTHFLNGGGPYGKLFDGVVSAYGASNVVGIETREVMDLPDGPLAVIAAFRAVRRQRLVGNDAPKLVVVDEFAAFLDNELFAREAEGWARELRKLRAALLLATQHVEDLGQGRGKVIFEQLANRIYLPNAEARRPAIAEAYRRVGLTEDHIELVASMQPKGEYLFQTQQSTRAGTIRLAGDALQICGSSTPRHHARARAMLASGIQPGAAFTKAWLAEGGDVSSLHVVAMDDAA